MVQLGLGWKATNDLLNHILFINIYLQIRCLPAVVVFSQHDSLFPSDCLTSVQAGLKGNLGMKLKVLWISCYEYVEIWWSIKQHFKIISLFFKWGLIHTVILFWSNWNKTVILEYGNFTASFMKVGIWNNKEYRMKHSKGICKWDKEVNFNFLYN